MLESVLESGSWGHSVLQTSALVIVFIKKCDLRYPLLGIRLPSTIFLKKKCKLSFVTILKGALRFRAVAYYLYYL